MHIPRSQFLALLLAYLLTGCGSVANISSDTSSGTSPQLTFTAISASPGTPQVGDAAIVTVIVYNAGTADATATTFSYTFQSVTSTGALPALAAGASTTLTFPVQSANAGAATVSVTLDAAGTVSESDESDNTRSLTITWTVTG